MKKWCWLVCLVWALLLPGYALAANQVPVYLEGQKLPGQALVRSNTSYLPMRALLESLGAEVNWDAGQQTVYAVQPNGHQVKIPLWGEYAEVTYHEGNNVYTVNSAYLPEQPPFTQNGRVYLPVRKVAELLGYQVDYAAGKVTVAAPKLQYTDKETGEYTLNLLTGELSLYAKRLGVIDLPSINSPGSWYPPVEFKVSRTPGGNYLFAARGSGSGALSFGYRLAAWLPLSNGMMTTQCCAHSIWGTVPEPIWAGGAVWLSDDKGIIVRVDDTNGHTNTYTLAIIYGDDLHKGFFCQWTDGRFLLLGDGADFDVYDIKTQTLYDLQAELITPQLKEQINSRLLEKSLLSRDNLERWWQCFGSVGFALDFGCPYLRFDATDNQGADGTLHFNLYAQYYGKESFVDELVATVYFTLPE